MFSFLVNIRPESTGNAIADELAIFKFDIGLTCSTSQLIIPCPNVASATNTTCTYTYMPHLPSTIPVPTQAYQIISSE
jgi:hypothetical protein